MRSELPWFAAAAALLAVAAPAQNVTVPSALQGVEGGGATNVPFGSNLACRYQCIYDAQELPWSGPRLIGGISIRADNGTPLSPGAPIAAKGFVELSVLLSTTHASAATASGTFEDNHGEDATTVLAYHRIQLPTQPAVAAGPRPANIDLMFPTPWFYGLTPARHNQPAPQNLLVEIWIHSQPSGAYRLDNLGGCIATAASFGNGLQCVVPATAPNTPAPVTLGTDASMVAGASFGWHVAGAPADAPFLLALNSSNQGGLFGNPLLPLPYPLFDPQNPSLPPQGLPGIFWPAPHCWLNITPATTILGVCGSNGLGSVVTNLPPGRQHVGFTLYGQAIVLAPTANLLGVVTSLGRHSTVCGPLGATRVHAFYNGSTTPTPPPPTSGQVQYGSGMIFEVR